MHLAISLTNTGTATCTLAGYPSLQLLGAAGASGGSGGSGSTGSTGSAGSTATTGSTGSAGSAAAATGSAAPGGSAGTTSTTVAGVTGGGSGGGSLGAGGPITVNVTEEGPPPRLVTLAPGQSGGFYLLDNTVEVNGVGCTQVTSIDVTPPGGAGSLPLDVNLTVCGGAIGVYAVVPLASLGG